MRARCDRRVECAVLFMAATFMYTADALQTHRHATFSGEMAADIAQRLKTAPVHPSKKHVPPDVDAVLRRVRSLNAVQTRLRDDTSASATLVVLQSSIGFGAQDEVAYVLEHEDATGEWGNVTTTSIVGCVWPYAMDDALKYFSLVSLFFWFVDVHHGRRFDLHMLTDDPQEAEMWKRVQDGRCS